MSAIIKLIGQRFGRLIVRRRAENIGRHVAWNCTCACGKRTVVTTCNLRKGHTQSCGCLRAEKARLSYPVHGMSRTAIYNSWTGMLDRVRNPNTRRYSRYGGRGITVCDRWLSFENFYADMGDRPSPDHSLDRVDNNGPYSPENCRWATLEEQNNNKVNNRFASVGGIAMTFARASRALGKYDDYVGLRVRKGTMQEVTRQGLPIGT